MNGGQGWQRPIYVLALLAIILLVYYYLMPAASQVAAVVLPLFTPFILAWVLAALLRPLVGLMEMRGLGRNLAVLLVLGVVVSGFLALGTWLVLRLYAELVRFSVFLPALSQDWSLKIQEGLVWLEQAYAHLELPVQVMDRIQVMAQQGLNTLNQWATSSINWIINFVTFLPGGFLTLLFTILATYFFLRDGEKLQKAFLRLVSPSWRRRLMQINRRLDEALVGFMQAQALLISITMLQTLVGLWFLRLDYIAVLTILVGVVDVLPILGPGAVFIPWAVWMFIQGETGRAVGLIVLYLIITIVRQAIQPRVLGKGVGLHPLETLAALYMGMRALGVTGVILGPILWVVIKAAWKAGVFSRDVGSPPAGGNKQAKT